MGVIVVVVVAVDHFHVATWAASVFL